MILGLFIGLIVGLAAGLWVSRWIGVTIVIPHFEQRYDALERVITDRAAASAPDPQTASDTPYKTIRRRRAAPVTPVR